MQIYTNKTNNTMFTLIILPTGFNKRLILTYLSEPICFEKYYCIFVKEKKKFWPNHLKHVTTTSLRYCIQLESFIIHPIMISFVALPQASPSV